MRRSTAFPRDWTSGAMPTSRRRLLGGIGATALLAGGGRAAAASTRRLHFLIPAAAGGGWDQTARAVADGLTRARLVESATLEHVTGGGGANAIGYLIATGERQHNTLMVSSTPIVLRAVRGAVPSYRELEPIAAVIGDYGAIVVRADSPHKDFASLAAAIRRAVGQFRIAGGSVRGDMDHVLAARTFSAASGVDPKEVVYFPYDAGGAALEALLGKHVHVLSTGLGEALDTPHARDIRVLAVTAPERVPDAAQLPTLRELGHDVTFVNWRGFFGPPQVPASTADAHAELLRRFLATPEWEDLRARHAWQTHFVARGDFRRFLETEEATAKRVLGAIGLG